MRSGGIAVLLASEDFGDDDHLKVLSLLLSDVMAYCLKHV